jgi:putative SOS response-associated peptidase YedK
MVKDEAHADMVRGFCFGGIYSHWTDKVNGGEVHETFLIITTPANALMETIHNTKKRMPLILSEADEEAWLTKEFNKDQISSLMKAYPTNQMVAHTITKRITAKDKDPNSLETLELGQYEGIDAWYETNEC